MRPEERPFRFGVMVDTRGSTRESLLELARHAEDAGIDTLLGTDHVGRRAPLPLLQEAASVTSLRIGPDFGRRSGPPPPRTHGIAEEELPHSPHYLVGDPSAMVEQLLEGRERWGISYVAMRPAHLPALAEVIRRLR